MTRDQAFNLPIPQDTETLIEWLNLRYPPEPLRSLGDEAVADSLRLAGQRDLIDFLCAEQARLHDE